MRSDKNLNQSYLTSPAWDQGGSGRTGAKELDRIRLPSLERGKMSFSGHERNHLFRNEGGKRFTDISGVSGLDSSLDGRSFAILDFDRDGRQDIALANVNAPVLNLYQNRTADSEENNSISSGNMIAVKVVGGNTTAQRSENLSNRDGVGARVSVSAGSQTLHRELRCGEGLAAQNSRNLFFGLGKEKTVDSIIVNWPSGKISEIENVLAGELITVFENVHQSEDGTGVQRTQYVMDGVADYRQQKHGTSKALFSPSGKRKGNYFMYVSMATWCPSCRRHLPQVKRIRDYFSDEQLALIGVPVDANDSDDMLIKFTNMYQPAYSLKKRWSRLELKKFTQITFDQFSTDLMPATIITDRQGQVLEVFRGVPTVSKIAEILSERK